MAANIDKAIAPLIRAIWKQGIITTNSCQENRPGIAWIAFANADEATYFLDLVAEYQTNYTGAFSDTLYSRIMGEEPNGWEYSCNLFNAAVEETRVGDTVYEKNTGPADFGFSVSIRFPVTDIPLILARLREVEAAHRREKRQR
jgi:hypothetical protein